MMVARLARIAELVMARRLADRVSGFSRYQLAERLGVSLKTIQRDMEFMQGLGYRFEYDRLGRCWRGSAPGRRIL